MNTPVKFELAKLLKEKGLNIPTQIYYEHALTSKKDSETNDYTGSFGWKKGETNLQSGYFKNNYGMADLSDENWYMCSAPTIAETIMWLYEKHGIWVMVEMTGSKRFYPRGRMIDKEGKHFVGDFKDEKGERLIYESPTRAYEAAIEYTLNNLL